MLAKHPPFQVPYIYFYERGFLLAHHVGTVGIERTLHTLEW